MEYDNQLWLICQPNSIYSKPTFSIVRDDRSSDNKLNIKLTLIKLRWKFIKLMNPVMRASLIGLTLDGLPYLLVTRLKFKNILSLNELLPLLVEFYGEVTSGNLIIRLIRNYPKRNSWLTTLTLSALLFQLTSPSHPKTYPPLLLPTTSPNSNDVTPTSEQETTKFQPEIPIGINDKLTMPTKSEKLVEEEIFTILRQFIPALFSTSVGLWLLKFNTGWNSKTFTKNRSNHVSLALYSTIQAGYTLWSFQRHRTIKLNQLWQVTTPWFNFSLDRFGDVTELMLFGLSSYQIMMTWFYHPHRLPPSYSKWITKFSEIEPILLQYLRGLANGTIREGDHSDFLKSYCHLLNLSPHLGDPYRRVPSCRLVHSVQSDSCPSHVIRRFYRTFIKALLSVYLPLNVLTFLWKLRSSTSSPSKQSSINPYPELIKNKVVLPACRSSAFLATFVATIFGSVCFTRQYYRTDHYGAQLGSFLCGFTALLVESPSRRLNLTLYLIPRALDTLYQGHLQPYLPAPYVENPLFALSLATLLTCYQLQPESVSPPLHSILRWVFHTPSLSPSPQ